jgi:predicted phage terminase large subunit-like protein
MNLSPAEQQAAVMAARQELLAFAAYMFWRRKGYTWRLAPHHLKICEALMRVFRGEITRLIINIPPRYSKTELAIVMFVAWCLGKVPDSEFIHVSYGSQIAVENATNVRSVMQHPAYGEIFQTRLASEAKNNWKTTDGGVLYSAGSDGSLTGMGAGKDREGFGGAILIDDPHKASEARSDVSRNAVIEWFQTTLESRKNSPQRTPIILVMQRLHEKDLAGWLLGDRGKDGTGPAVPGGNGEVWHHLCMPAIQADGTPLWPEKHDIDALRLMERAAPYVFSGQYQQRPSPAEGAIFKPDALETVEAVPAVNITWVRAWDLASLDKDGDYTAGPKLGKLPDGRFIIADMVLDQLGPDARDAAIKNTAARDGRQVRISLPQDPGQAGKTQALYMTRMLAGYSVHTSPESGDKITRAEPLAAQVNVGNVLMLKAPWNDRLINEMRMFPNGANDDQVDGLSRAFEALMGGSTGMLDFLGAQAAEMRRRQEEQKAEHQKQGA